jgi:uncharacterized protein YbcI
LIKYKQEDLLQLSSFVSKQLKSSFGKGPEKCTSFSDGKYVVFTLRKFIAPMEESLLKQGKNELVEDVRSVIMKEITFDIQIGISETLNQDVEYISYDWNFESNTGIIIAVLSTKEIHSTYSGKQEFESEWLQHTRQLYKEPDTIQSKFLHKYLLLVDCSGALLPIEKTLVEKGHAGLLVETKNELRKQYEERLHLLQRSLEIQLSEVFIAWDYKSDRRIICFMQE